MSTSAMKQALEALDIIKASCSEGRVAHAENEAAIAEYILRQAIAEAEKQEPVVGTKTWFEDGKMVTQHLYASDISQERVDETAKREREWVGLTDEEVVDLACSVDSYKGLCQATEAKLKEKNA